MNESNIQPYNKHNLYKRRTAMSLVLGPIHYLMYQKMNYQEALTSAILSDYPELEAKITKEQPPIEQGDLVDLIDQTNIHGWLSSRIDMVESRLAAALKYAPNALETVFEMGIKAGESADFSTLETIFNQLNPFLLDGMPCDRGLSANVVEGESALYLVQGADVHPCFFLEQPLNISPEDSLTKTCAGGHDHDHHESFDIHQSLPPSANDLEATPFARFRYAFLSGYFKNSPYQVEFINEKDFKISLR